MQIDTKWEEKLKLFKSEFEYYFEGYDPKTEKHLLLAYSQCRLTQELINVQKEEQN